MTRRRGSLAARLAIGFTLAAFLLVVGVTTTIYFDFTARLLGEDDEFLADNVRVIAGLLQERPVDEEMLRREVVWEWAKRKHSRVYVRLLRGSPAVEETEEMRAMLPPSVFPAPASGVGVGSLAFANHTVPPDRPFRIASARVDVGSDAPNAVVQIALDRSGEASLLAAHRTRLLLVLGAALGACGLGGYIVARRGMRPVRRMAATIGGIRPTNLGPRLDPATLPSELATLAERFNDMLDRLEDSFARLSRFSADLAHELRTPVQIVRGEIEVALGRQRTPAEYRDVLSSALEECLRLSDLIDRMLFLARADDPRTQIRRDTVNLARELASVCDFYEASATEKGVRLSVDTDDIEVRADRVLLQRALGNLVANGIAHTPRGGEVALSAARTGRGVEIRVRDTGVGIPEESQRHVFERFFRADPARSGNAPGAGLGLPIVQSIVHLHGGTVALQSTPGVGTTVTMTLPADGVPATRPPGAAVGSGG